MAAPVQPAPSGQPGQAGRVIPREGSPSPSTQPTNQPAAPATEGGAPAQSGASVQPPTPQEPSAEQRLLAAQEAVIRDQQAQISRLSRTHESFDGRIRNLESPPPSKDDQNQRFWKDPVGVMNELIQGELKKTVDPINQYISGQRTESVYDRMKGRLKQEYGELWPHIEGEIDRFVQAASAAGNAVNDDLMNVAALAATGAYHRGLLGPTSTQPGGNGVPPAPPAAPSPQPAAPAAPRNDVATPPHLRPSAPVVPGHERAQEPALRDLTENEARLARERGMSKEQFLAWIDTPPDQVVHSKIGKEQPKS